MFLATAFMLVDGRSEFEGTPQVVCLAACVLGQAEQQNIAALALAGEAANHLWAAESQTVAPLQWGAVGFAGG